MSTSHLSRAAVGVAALLVAVVVSGCEEDDPSTSPTPSSSPSEPESSSPSEPTTTPTGPVEPTLPSEAKEETQAGLRAFVTYYYEVINFATSTGDVDELKAVAEPSCTGCQGPIELIERVYDRGGRIAGGGYRVIDLDPAPLANGFWTVEARTRIGDQFVRDAGDLNKRYPGGRGGLRFTLRYRASSWRVTSLESL
jgi:hypothetical protein